MGNKNSEPSVTEEELKYIIDEIQDEGVLEEQESELVRSALDFDEITISEILVPRVNIEGVELHEDMESIKNVLCRQSFQGFLFMTRTLTTLWDLSTSLTFLKCISRARRT